MQDRCIRNACKIRNNLIVPGSSIVFGDSTAGLGIAGITYCIPVGDYLSSCILDSVLDLLACNPRDTLIALAVIICAYVVEVMVFPVISAYHFLSQFTSPSCQ